MSEQPEHLVKRYDLELKRLRSLLTQMGGIVESQVALAAQAIMHRDAAAATRAVSEDPKVDALEREVGDASFCETFVLPRPHLFSNVPVFLSASAVAEMQDLVRAIETTSRLPAYRAAVLSWAPEIAREDHGPVGACFGRPANSVG